MARNVLAHIAAAHPLVSLAPPPATKRANLVFFRCGAQSLHRKLYPLPAGRNWDCALSCYEEPAGADAAQADYLLIGGVSKWDAFAQARFERPALGFDAYERTFLVDDDIEFEAVSDIDRLFEIAREYEFAICQPSLSTRSFAHWLVTRHHASTLLRFTNFVECMAPMLSAEAVRLLEADIRAAVSGCGLDLVFHKVMGEQRKMGVIDTVTVTHTKPVDTQGGRFYQYLRSIGVDHEEETRWFLARHGLTGFSATMLAGVTLLQHAHVPPAASGQ